MTYGNDLVVLDASHTADGYVMICYNGSNEKVKLQVTSPDGTEYTYPVTVVGDYAALMSAMLRSQRIPTKLEVGYSGDVYHAWISCYVDEIGWVDNIIEFDGKNWSIMDPTLAANNSASDVKKYVGNGKNYVTKYTY